MAFEKTTGRMKSTDGEHGLRWVVWKPREGSPKAMLQISHGMCEYLERYEDFAGYLCEHGVLVCGCEHLGHGPAAREAGTLGFFAKKDGWKLPPADVRKFALQMKKQYPGLPHFLLGHSMGSFIARICLAKYGELWDGAAIMGTGGHNPFCGLGIRIAGHYIRKNGPASYSNTVKNLSMGNYNKRFKAEHCSSSWLTKERAIREKYDADPLCSFPFTVSAYRDLFTMVKVVSLPETYARIPKELPILLVSGRDDPVGNYGKGVTEVYERLKQAGVKNVKLKLYDNDRHEILNETDRQTVYADILALLAG